MTPPAAASPADARVRVGRLSSRPLQIALSLASGLSVKQAAAALGISPKTAEYHRGVAYAKLGVNNIADLTRLMMRAGKVD